jgi:trans-2,3-dihydro-3-hydroxyanthranilate isomerase
MSEYTYYTADVFTDRVFGGNPLAVLPDARGLDAASMQLIAREFNFSESVFVLPPDDAAHTRRLRIFTPGGELPFAGHPTVGTAFILASSGALDLTGNLTRIVFEEGVGPVPVAIRARDGVPYYTQLSAAKMPEFGPEPPPVAEIARAFSLNPGDFLGGEYAPQAVSCGVPFLFAPLANRAALARIRLDRAAWERSLSGFWAPEVFLFSFETERPSSDLHARMFAPRLGVPEDPATGAAATALAGYLSRRDRSPAAKLSWVVEQGFEMGRPSLLEVEAERQGGKVTAIRVGGASVMVSRGILSLP